ncbi:MAG: N-acetylmuramoyl-L-alanine amidase [Cyanobacteria bacterium K_DeepCast_35m_m1_288]|nr:N-acetylmuramoyl-L-alanine amidase [Cyanobacteria bacterium K_DeepCast_35m_m1_288]
MACLSGLRRSVLLAGLLLATLGLAAAAEAPAPRSGCSDPLTGVRSRLQRDWVGRRAVGREVEILVMAGHADSQGIPGAGTSGAAVDLAGARPMQPGIRDELYWNLEVARRVVELGRQRGLNIRFYDPLVRTIHNGDDPRTNWSVGKAHAAAGGYALEIHFDAYGPDGVGSGVIPALHRPHSSIDESLAQAFGGYPRQFRGGLGGPRRGITILEIGKLEAPLEPALRNPATREQALTVITARVVNALELGVGGAATPTAAAGLKPASVHSPVGLAAGDQ